LKVDPASAAISIAACFNGPPASGNGGYSCGVLAIMLEGAARVRLFAPPPLDKTLSVSCHEDGHLEMHDGETLVGAAYPAELDLEVPPAPTLEQAKQASKSFPCYQEHAYPRCYVCGPERRHEDGLCLFPGPVNDWSLLACPWVPSANTLDDVGNVRPEIVWSALDCPGYFAAVGEDLPVTLLGELTGEILATVPGDRPLVVYCWPLGREGRKAWGATAIANQEGEVLALSRSLWITLKAGQ
jgi:hypothetical protein